MRRKRVDWVKVVVIVSLAIMALVYAIGKYRLIVEARQQNPFVEPVKIRATCYCDEGKTASGSDTRLGIIASKPEYLGYVACINAVNEDGSVGEFIGFYEVLDTGYGRGTGIGQSKIFSNRTLGTIEAGETIDFYMPTTHQAEEWVDTYGDYVYVKFVKGER